MKKTKNYKVFLIITVLMLTGCSNTQISDDTNNIDSPGKKIGADEVASQTELNENHTDSDGNTEVADEIFYGMVKRIIGNEVEIEIGLVPDWNGGNGDENIEPEDKKNPGVPMVKVEEKENSSGFEDYHAPDPNNPIYGEDGEVNLTYTDESRTLIIPAGTDIRNTLGKKATLASIKKGSVLMIKPKVIDGKDAGIDRLTILN